MADITTYTGSITPNANFKFQSSLEMQRLCKSMFNKALQSSPGEAAEFYAIQKYFVTQID